MIKLKYYILLLTYVFDKNIKKIKTYYKNASKILVSIRNLQPISILNSKFNDKTYDNAYEKLHKTLLNLYAKNTHLKSILIKMVGKIYDFTFKILKISSINKKSIGFNQLFDIKTQIW